MKTKREAIILILSGLIIGFLGAMLYIISDGEIIWVGFQGLGIGTIVASVVYLVKNKSAF